MTGSRRLVALLGAGMIMVAGVPAAHAATNGQLRHAAACGGAPADFDGGFRDDQYPEVGILFQVSLEGKDTVFYRGNPIGSGSAEASGGVITWTQDDSGTVVSYTSTRVLCLNLLEPTQVTEITARPSDGSDSISLIRA
jgi:hypothetical protein